jgi:hypothetical protein
MDAHREGYPCRLYFDVEFETSANPSLDGAKLVEELIALTTEVLEEALDVRVDRRAFLEMDSSTPAKFSRWVEWVGAACVRRSSRCIWLQGKGLDKGQRMCCACLTAGTWWCTCPRVGCSAATPTSAGSCSGSSPRQGRPQSR